MIPVSGIIIANSAFPAREDFVDQGEMSFNDHLALPALGPVDSRSIPLM